MKRVLKFEGNQAIYMALINALRFGRNNIQTAPGKDVIRRERDIRRLLEGLGNHEPAAEKYVLKDGLHSITVQQAEIDLLQERIDKGSWTGDGGIDMADAYDFLSAAPEEKVQA